MRVVTSVRPCRSAARQRWVGGHPAHEHWVYCSTVYTLVRQKRMHGPVLPYARVRFFLCMNCKRELGFQSCCGSLAS